MGDQACGGLGEACLTKPAYRDFPIAVPPRGQQKGDSSATWGPSIQRQGPMGAILVQSTTGQTQSLPQGWQKVIAALVQDHSTQSRAEPRTHQDCLSILFL